MKHITCNIKHITCNIKQKIKKLRFSLLHDTCYMIHERGFTILETLVAITLLSMAILGPMELASRSIGSAMVSQNQITAFYLSQEALEYIRNIRDNNLINSLPWISGGNLDECTGNDCIIDVPNSTLGDPSGNITACIGTCPKLKYDDAGGYYYNHISGNETIFTRKARIITPVNGNSDEAKIEITTSWDEKTGTRSVYLEEYVFNWR